MGLSAWKIENFKPYNELSLQILQRVHKALGSRNLIVAALALALLVSDNIDIFLRTVGIIMGLLGFSPLVQTILTTLPMKVMCGQ